jgi:hypothetical protein
MSGFKYEVLTGDDLISALRGGRTGDLLEDAAYAAADEIERLREQLRLCNIDQCNTEAWLAEAVEYGTGYKQARDEAMANYQAALARLEEAGRVLNHIYATVYNAETRSMIQTFLRAE